MAALLVLVMLSFHAAVVPAQKAEALDLQAMALFPEDAAAVGLDDYQIAGGNIRVAENQAFWLAVYTETDVNDFEDSFSEAGIDQIYELFLDRSADSNDPESELESSIVTAVYAGDDEQSAEELFNLIADGWLGVAQEEVNVDSVGDASVLTMHEGRDPYIGERASWLNFTILAGTDVLSVALVDYVREEPDGDAAADLGERLVERVEAVRAGEGPDLAPLAVQLVPDEQIASQSGSYLQIDGETYPAVESTSGLGKYLETTVDNTERAEFYEDIGAVDVLFAQQQLRGGPEGGSQDYYLEVVVIRFEDEAAAEDYMADVPDMLADDPGIDDLREIGDVPRAGDEARSFTYEVEGLFYHQPTYVRDDDIIARVTVMGVEPTEAGAILIAEAQAACLAERDCSTPIEPPEELMED
jgi:hypothetical protein